MMLAAIYHSASTRWEFYPAGLILLMDQRLLGQCPAVDWTRARRPKEYWICVADLGRVGDRSCMATKVPTPVRRGAVIRTSTTIRLGEGGISKTACAAKRPDETAEEYQQQKQPAEFQGPTNSDHRASLSELDFHGWFTTSP